MPTLLTHTLYTRYIYTGTFSNGYGHLRIWNTVSNTYLNKYLYRWLNIISILCAWHQLCCDISQLVTDTFQTLLCRLFERDLIFFSRYLVWPQDCLRWRMQKQRSQLWTWTQVKGWDKTPHVGRKHKQHDKTFQYTAKLFPCLFKTSCFHEQQKRPSTACLWGLRPLFPKPLHHHNSTSSHLLWYLHEDPQMVESHPVDTYLPRPVTTEPGSIPIYQKRVMRALIWAFSIPSAFSQNSQQGSYFEISTSLPG